MRKPNKVDLINSKGVVKTFGYDHALSLLTFSSLWSLPEDSKYELTDNGIRTKSDSGTDKGAEK